jgi:hypothetical protein
MDFSFQRLSFLLWYGASMVPTPKVSLAERTVTLTPTADRQTTDMTKRLAAATITLTPDMETLAPNGTLTTFDAPLPPII